MADNKGMTAVAVLAVSVIVLGAFGGAVALTIADKDATPFITMSGGMLAVVVNVIAVIYGFNKVSKDNSMIKRSVNGYTSKLLDLVDTGSLSVEDKEKVAEIRAHNETLASGRHVKE